MTKLLMALFLLAAPVVADDLLLSTETPCIPVGDTVQVAIEVEHLSAPVNGVQVLFHYDTAMLALVDVEPAGDWTEIAQGDVNGEAWYAAAIFGGSVEGDGPHLVATATFSATATGLTGFAFRDDPLYQTRVTYTDNSLAPVTTHDSEAVRVCDGEWCCFPGAADSGRTILTGHEPSGLAWHAGLGAWIVADDGGQVFAVSPEGTLLRTYAVGGDLEAVAVQDSASPYVYLGRENPDAILRLNIWSGAVEATWDLTAWMQSSDPNQGLEALASDGTLFYAGLQADGRIYVFDLATTPATFVRSFATPIGYDISGLDWRGGLVAVYDSANLIVWMDTNGVELARAAAPGDAQEGIAFRACELGIAEDTGRVVVYADWLDGGCASVADLDNDGDVDLADYAVFQREMEPLSWR